MTPALSSRKAHIAYCLSGRDLGALAWMFPNADNLTMMLPAWSPGNKETVLHYRRGWSMLQENGFFGCRLSSTVLLSGPTDDCIIGTAVAELRHSNASRARCLCFLKLGYGSQGRRVSQSFVGGFPINIGKESFDILASTGGGIVQNECMLPNVHNQERFEARRHSILM